MTTPSVRNVDLQEAINELKQMSLDRWKIQDNNTKRINTIEPEVERLAKGFITHDILLNGVPNDRNDQGIVGAINDIAQFIESIKAWSKPLLSAVIIWAVLGGLEKLIDVVMTVEKLAK